MSDSDCTALTHAVAEGFTITPFGRSDPLSAELAHDTWVKDETGNVAGVAQGPPPRPDRAPPASR